MLRTLRTSIDNHRTVCKLPVQTDALGPSVMFWEGRRMAPHRSIWSRRDLFVGGGAVSLAGIAGGTGLGFAPSAAAAEPAPLINGGFEEPVVDGVIPGWRQTFGSEPAFSVVTEPVAEGGQAVLMDDALETSSAGLQSAQFAVSGDRMCDVSAKLYRLSGMVWLYVYFYDADGNQLVQVTNWFQPPLDTWSTIGLTAYAPPNAV